MRNLILSLVLLLPLPSIAGTKVLDTLTVSKYVTPDIYEVPITVKAKSFKEEEVLSKLAKVDRSLKSLNLPYQGGTFQVYENRYWDSARKEYITEGFVGTIRYTFNLKNVEQQEEIFKTLNYYSKAEKVRYSVDSPRWIVSEQKRERVREKLKKKLIKKAIKESKELSRELGSYCSIAEIRFKPFSNYPIPIYRAALKSQIAPQPKKNAKEIYIKANVEFRCDRRR